MAGTRALFASIGASAALVAAAALSLLTISAVFAFGGWSAPASPFVEQPALVLAAVDDAEAPITASGASPIVAPAPARRAERRAAPRAAAPRAGAPEPAATHGSAGIPRVVSPRPIESDEAGRTPAPPAAPKTGDHVRKVGDSLSATVEGTGAALASITQPLAAPVSAVAQQVLNLLAEVVNRATDGLGGAVDSLLAPK